MYIYIFTSTHHRLYVYIYIYIYDSGLIYIYILVISGLIYIYIDLRCIIDLYNIVMKPPGRLTLFSLTPMIWRSDFGPQTGRSREFQDVTGVDCCPRMLQKLSEFVLGKLPRIGR
jgi:hypothetical protein